MLYVVRHGRVRQNKLEKVLGSGKKNPLLDAEGREEAIEIGKRFRDIKFEVAICSPLVRASETAIFILSENLAVPPPRLLRDPRITERNYGQWEDKDYDKLPYYKNRWQPDFKCSVYGIEPIAAMYARTLSFFSDVERNYAGKDVLVVTHDGVIRMLKVYKGECSINEDLAPYGIDNCEVLTYDI